MKKTLLNKFLPLMLLLLAQGAWAQSGKLWSTRFYNAVPVPPPVNGPTYSFRAMPSTHNFNPGQADTTNFTDTIYNRSIPSYCYNTTGSTAMSYLGPTLIWNKGTNMTFNITNNLPVLPPGNETTVHWHGMNLPALVDGGPHEMIMNGMPWMVPPAMMPPMFNAIDDVQTGWYHSHLMDITTEQVTMGLAGMVILQDPTGDPNYNTLPHNYGTNDFPIVIQEKSFNFDSIGSGANKQMYVSSMTLTPHIGNGPVTLVNGVMNGYLRVPPQQVRLRVLNGSPRKSFQVGLSATLMKPSVFNTMYLVGTDGGYTGIPYPMDSILISPGERMEMVASFIGKSHGDTVYLSNLVRSVPKDIITGGGTPGGGGFPNFSSNTPGYAFMAFIVDTSIHPANPILTLPTTLTNYTVDTTNIFKRRTKVLQQFGGNNNGVWKIDSTGMDMGRIDDTILVNTKEMWTIKNTTIVSHPFHIHKVQFQVVYLRDSNDNIIAAYPNLPKNLMGYKDDVLVRAKTSLTYIARFDSFPSIGYDTMDGFMYHCHILTHEDDSMMHQFVVVDSNTYYNIPVGVKNPVAMGSLMLYPNPAGDVLNLKGNSTTTATLRITDIMGRLLKEETFPPFSGITKIPVADLPRGVVLVEWTSGSQHVVQKVLLK